MSANIPSLAATGVQMMTAVPGCKYSCAIHNVLGVNHTFILEQYLGVNHTFILELFFPSGNAHRTLCVDMVRASAG